jgi:hypothetical protein
MERNEFYKHLPATHLNNGRKVRARVEFFEELENKSFINKATGRIMSSKTFEIYKPAAAMDGITTIIMGNVQSTNTDHLHQVLPKKNPASDNFRPVQILIK